MNETTTPGGTAIVEEDSFPTQRPCTRCDSDQHLVGAFDGLGKYRCDSCEMVVGFDVAADVPEFLLHRGVPSRYTKERFGDRLMNAELRIEHRDRELSTTD